MERGDRHGIGERVKYGIIYWLIILHESTFLVVHHYPQRE
jgi:hypothetical protein